MLEMVQTSIPEVKLFKMRKFGDHRGFFSETYSMRDLERFGVAITFVQDNHSMSAAVGTIRGLHFQTPPRAQDKLLRVVRGAIYDVAVDIRKGSPTYGRHVGAVVSAAEWNQILVPAGFAHGFCTLEPDTEVLYKVSDYYSPEHEAGIPWNDPALGIQWPLTDEPVLSGKDQAYPPFAELPDYFTFTPR